MAKYSNQSFVELRRHGYRSYNPCVRQAIEYPRRGKRRGRDFSKFCNDLYKRVAATLKREFAEAGRFLPELRLKWKIRQALDWYFWFYRKHHRTGERLPMEPPEWLIDELQRQGSWRPKLRAEKPATKRIRVTLDLDEEGVARLVAAGIIRPPRRRRQKRPAAATYQPSTDGVGASLGASCEADSSENRENCTPTATARPLAA